MRITIGSWQGNFEIIVVILLIIIIMVAHVGCSCSRFTKRDYYDIFGQVREGFGGIGRYSPYSKQGVPALQSPEEIRARKPQQIPLPEGEMLMFANTPFKPECCPGTYSNSSGCFCGTSQQYNYLITRGGNNVPYSRLKSFLSIS
jgi:hypothetical protein